MKFASLSRGIYTGLACPHSRKKSGNKKNWPFRVDFLNADRDASPWLGWKFTSAMSYRLCGRQRPIEKQLYQLGLSSVFLKTADQVEKGNGMDKGRDKSQALEVIDGVGCEGFPSRERWRRKVWEVYNNHLAAKDRYTKCHTGALRFSIGLSTQN